MHLFGRKMPEQYEVEAWWKSLDDMQRLGIMMREKPPEPKKIEDEALVWVVFADGSETEAVTRYVYLFENNGSISIKPVNKPWKIKIEKKGVVKEVRIQPNSYGGLSVALPMNKYVAKGEEIQVQ